MTSAIHALAIPKLGLTMKTGSIAAWRVKPGDEVTEGKPVADIETEKITSEYEAPMSGILRRQVATRLNHRRLQMSLQAAFIFLAPEADPAKHRSVVHTPQVDLTVVGVTNYAQAERVAKSLVEQGIAAIELCGGFGTAGAARIAQAVAGKAAVGVVRFDGHPGLDGKSGDTLFAA